MNDIKKLARELRSFVAKRNWAKYHTPKNLAMGLATEAGELLEVFLWLTPSESRKLTRGKQQQLKEELGDIFIYLVNIADKFNLDLVECAREKLKLNAKKYPHEKVRGSARKYTEYRSSSGSA